MSQANNLLAHFLKVYKERPKSLAVQYFKKNNLYSLNWSQVYDRVEQQFNSLRALGVRPGDRVAIFSDTCKEWGFIDLAVLANKAITVPVYHSSHIKDIEYILNDSKPQVLFVQNEALYRKIKDLDVYKKIEKVVMIDEFKCSDDKVYFLKQIVDLPQITSPLDELVSEIDLDQLATIIYTSGTSGTPKGVCLRHRQIMSAISEVFPLLGVTPSDKTLTFLPFSHILGRLELWGHYFCGYTIAYAESIEKIKRNIATAHPTVIVGVPRIFEKIYFGILAQVEISKLKQMIFNRALKVGKKNTQLRGEKKAPSFLQALKSQVAHQLVFSQIQEKLGGQMRFAVSGGAPLDPQIADFFSACGLPILEGYGLTESTGPISINTLFEHKTGTVGKAYGDVEFRIAEDQEILVKSDKIMTEYYQNDEATQQAFTEDGFFKTGDIGEIDEQGFLSITDRKKDLIKTAGGKFIAPQKLQNLFSTEPLIGPIHVHGDKKKFVVALITLEPDELMRLKKEHGLKSETYAELSRSSIVKKEVKAAVTRVNSQLASFETIKRYEILDHEFTVEGGQITPSLKMKRKSIDEMYKETIDTLYN